MGTDASPLNTCVVDSHLDAGSDGDADRVDKLRRDANTLPGGWWQPALVKMRVHTRCSNTAPASAVTTVLRVRVSTINQGSKQARNF